MTERDLNRLANRLAREYFYSARLTVRLGDTPAGAKLRALMYPPATGKVHYAPGVGPK